MIALILAAAGAVVFVLRLAALARLARAAPAAPPSPFPRVSVIVPARNEAHNLPRLLASLARLHPAPAEVIVVDDGSRDGTGDLARAAGATVVEPGPLPEGWLGKPWACARGAAVATGELILFTDADTEHAPDSLGRAVARLTETGAGLCSVVPTHRVVAPWERLQGLFQLLLLVATRAGAPGAGEREFAIGQYLLFRRATYEKTGGHASVKGRVAEDLAFARAVRDGGDRTALVYAPGTLGVRMYPEGVGAFLRGWRRNFREGLRSAGLVGVAEIALVIAWLGGLPIALAQALVGGHLALAAVLGLALGGTLVLLAHRQRMVGAFPSLGTLGYPLALLAFVAVSAAAAWDRLRGAPVIWRGRVVRR